MKKYLKYQLRKIFSFSTRTFSGYHREGLRIVAKGALKHRVLLFLAFVTSTASVFFEAGSIGLLALSVEILLGQGPIDFTSLGILKEYLESPIGYRIQQFSRAGLFLTLILIAMVAQVARSGLTYANIVLSLKLGRRVSEDLQGSITNKIINMDYQSITQYATGVLNEQIKLGASVSTLIGVANHTILALSLITIYIGLMLVISPSLTFVAIVTVVLIFIVLTRVVRILKLLGDRRTESLLKIGHITVDYLNAARLIRIFYIGKSTEKTINSERSEFLRLNEQSGIVAAAVAPSIQALTIVGAGLFLISSYFLAEGSVREVLPTTMLFLVILNRMMPQVQYLNKARIVLAGKMQELEEISKVFLDKEDQSSQHKKRSVSTLAKKVSFNCLSFRYNKAKVDVLTEVDVSFLKGQTVVLLGRSGEGKSTISDLILGLIHPTHGYISVDNIDLKEINIEDWRGCIGVVDQECFLLNATVRDNIVFGRSSYSKEDVEKAARAAHAHEFIEKLKDGYDTVIGDRGYFLSGGQQQRLGIARALLSDPEILILDEPTSALDPESEKLFRKTIREFHSLKTILLIAHDMSLATEADRVLVVEGGKISESDVTNRIMPEIT